MILAYNPDDWYWLADDGRIYSSAAHGVVASTIAAYADWKGKGGVPTIWPRDDAGEQTQASLDAVLAPIADVSRAQAKIQLHRMGKLDAVKALVGSADPEVQIWFAEASTWQRHNPHVVAIGQALKMADADLDAAFVAAAQIVA